MARALLLMLLKAYRLLISPALGPSCRYEPSCSTYALHAVERHGALAGSGLAVWRVLRCHPWCDGGCDPVPDHLPALFTRWIASDPPSAASTDGTVRKTLE